jgi:hypothetical protein
MQSSLALLIAAQLLFKYHNAPSSGIGCICTAGSSRCPTQLGTAMMLYDDGQTKAMVVRTQLDVDM